MVRIKELTEIEELAADDEIAISDTSENKDKKLKVDLLLLKHELFVLDAYDIANKYVEVEGTINNNQSIRVFVDNIGIKAEQGVDYSVSGNQIFWNTYNSRDYTGRWINADYHKLPQSFHRYFEEEVQPLDKRG